MRYALLAATLMFALSPLATGGFGGFDPADFPIPQDDPPVQPPGWAFSIWGVIYLWLVAHAVFGALYRPNASSWRPTRLPLALSLAIGAAWIPVANLSPIWATVLILIMLATALVAVLRAGAGDFWLLGAPLGLYAGWLTAASAVSLALLAAGYGLLSEETAALAALVVIVPVALSVIWAGATITYPAAIVWALVAIGLRDPVTILGAVTFALSILLGGAALWRLRT